MRSNAESIFFDRRDPQIQIPFVEALYDGGPFLQSIPSALSPDGIFVCQVGEAPDLTSPSDDVSVNRNRGNFFRSLTKLGFEGSRDYEEVISRLHRALWQFHFSGLTQSQP